MDDQDLGPAAFLSYAQIDDASRQISSLRKRLEREARMHLGEEFRIFQDRVDLGWGEDWRSQIFSALGRTTVLIAILTPNYFKSPNCRDELQAFLQHEQELGIEGLILPLYYVPIPRLKDPATLEADRLLAAIAGRHWENWRELRLKRFDDPAVRQAVALLAEKLQGVVERLSAGETRKGARAVDPPEARPGSMSRTLRGAVGADRPQGASPKASGRGEPGSPRPRAHPEAASPPSAEPLSPAPGSSTPVVLAPERPARAPVPDAAPSPVPAHRAGAPLVEHPVRRGLSPRSVDAALGIAAAATVVGLAWMLAGRGSAAPALHLWAAPPVDATAPCRRGAMFYEPDLVHAWNLMGALSAAGTVLAVLACYALPRASLGPRFVHRWYASLAIVMALCFLAPTAVAALVRVGASCGEVGGSFYFTSERIPYALVLPRMVAGLVWGLGAFTLASLLATRVVARGPFAGGFYHYRGCPWPRWRPLDR